jgi:hypothetical protein
MIDMQALIDDLGPWVIGIGILSAIVQIRKKGREAAQAREQAHSEAMLAEARTFVAQVLERRTFPRPAPSIIPERSGQAILYVEAATLYELHTSTMRGYAGTRVKVGGMPLYLGGSSPITSTSIQSTSDGELALTTQALVFSGSMKAQTLPLKRISGIQVMNDAFQITLDGRAKPLWFKVRNPILWTSMIKLAMRAGLTSREIPETAMTLLSNSPA